MSATLQGRKPKDARKIVVVSTSLLLGLFFIVVTYLRAKSIVSEEGYTFADLGFVVIEGLIVLSIFIGASVYLIFNIKEKNTVVGTITNRDAFSKNESKHAYFSAIFALLNFSIVLAPIAAPVSIYYAIKGIKECRSEKKSGIMWAVLGLMISVPVAIYFISVFFWITFLEQ